MRRENGKHQQAPRVDEDPDTGDDQDNDGDGDFDEDDEGDADPTEGDEVDDDGDGAVDEDGESNLDPTKALLGARFAVLFISICICMNRVFAQLSAWVFAVTFDRLALSEDWVDTLVIISGLSAVPIS